MQESLNLHGFEVSAARLEAEWTVVIDTPSAGVTSLVRALEQSIPLVQGPYDCCSFIQESGRQRFRALEGSHAGAEGTVQETAASRVIFSIPTDKKLLQKVFETIFTFHVNEEPTIRVYPSFGSRSKFLDDKDNPNRYWNRTDANEIHGQASVDQT